MRDYDPMRQKHQSPDCHLDSVVIAVVVEPLFSIRGQNGQLLKLESSCSIQ